MIKKVVIKNLNTSLPYLALGKIKFYDNFGNVIDSGEVTIDTPMLGETENFKCSVSGSYVGSSPSNIINLVNTSTINNYWIADTTTNVAVTLYFKKFIDSISKITIIPLPSTNTSLGVTKPFDIDIYNYKDEIIQSYNVIPNTIRGDGLTEQTVNTYKIMKYYIVSDSPETIHTTETIRLRNINRIVKAEVEQDEPTGTTIRYLFSIDNRNTWFAIKSNNLIEVNKEDILTKGMSKTELEQINGYYFDSTYNLDIMAGLQTTDKMLTPIIHKIKIQY